jgi:uncharacterized protein with ATP-grasp and redox domains
MNEINRQRLPLPEPLRGCEINSFAHDTVVRRLPIIAGRTLAENSFPPSVERALEQLISEIPHAHIRPLEDPDAPDAPAWEGYVAPYLRMDWLEIPWLFAEFYFFRRILEATGYFCPRRPCYGLDPFLLQKRTGLETSREAVRALSIQLGHMIEGAIAAREALSRMLLVSLLGNRADYSLWPAGEDEQRLHDSEKDDPDRIIINDTPAVVDYFSGLKPGSVCLHFLLDNAGFELVSDLCIIDYLLSSGLAGSICFHVKAYPIYVSDAMMKDVEETIVFMASDTGPSLQAIAKRLRDHTNQGRLEGQAELFWTSPLEMWEMPEMIGKRLAQSDLVIGKGDANYRRLVGDRHWPETTPFAEIISYFPAPLVALRTFKSEVHCGMKPGQAKALDREDPHWRTNGERGVIQFYRPE